MREKGALKASTAEDRRVRGIVRAMRIVPDAALGKIHSMLSGIGEMMGCPIVWVDANSQLNGIHYRNVTFLNRKAGMDLKKTFWHEQFHWIKANNTALYEELLSCFKGRKAFTKEQLDKYRRDSGRSSLTDAAVIEEILADEFMSVFKRVPMLQEMPGKSRHWRKGSSLGSSG